MQSVFRSTVAPARPARQSTVQVAAGTSRRAEVQKRHKRIRQKLSGTTERPRLAVFRSNEHIYAQVIDDTVGHTLAAASTLMSDIKTSLESTATVAAAELVGKKIAEQCVAKNITKVAFDRGGNIYTGRVAAVAEGARSGGLQF